MVGRACSGGLPFGSIRPLKPFCSTCRAERMSHNFSDHASKPRCRNPTCQFAHQLSPPHHTSHSFPDIALLFLFFSIESLLSLYNFRFLKFLNPSQRV